MALEIEKKYVLKNVPLVKWDKELYLEQFYCEMNGEKFRLRMSRNLITGTTIFHKTIKIFISAGINEEIENEIDLKEFEKVIKGGFAKTWLRKFRYVKKFGKLKWEVDKYCDICLVTAEIELPAMDHMFKFPEYIEKVMVADVTKIKGFSNKNMAECYEPH